MYKVKVTNVPKWISEIHLKHHFSNCGKILFAEVTSQQNSKSSIGMITFESEQSLNKALKYNGKKLDGATINIERADALNLQGAVTG